MSAPPSHAPLQPATVRLLPYHFAKSKGVITAREEGGEIEVWLAPDPASSTLAEVRRLTGKTLKPVLLSKEEFQSRLASKAYAGGEGGSALNEAVQEIASNIQSAADLSALTASLPEVTDLLEMENDAPIIKLINALLTQVVREGASDLHFEIFERRALVRFRVDGTLRDVDRVPGTSRGASAVPGGTAEVRVWQSLRVLCCSRRHGARRRDPAASQGPSAVQHGLIADGNSQSQLAVST